MTLWRKYAVQAYGEKHAHYHARIHLITGASIIIDDDHIIISNKLTTIAIFTAPDCYQKNARAFSVLLYTRNSLLTFMHAHVIRVRRRKAVKLIYVYSKLTALNSEEFQLSCLHGVAISYYGSQGQKVKQVASTRRVADVDNISVTRCGDNS